MSHTVISHDESSLLLTLAEISHLVSHSHDPGQTLDNIVRLIQRRFHTDVCSVYLLEAERGELVLGATVGLKPESVGRVRMRLDEGLTGLVAEQLAPVTVSDAFQHARFKYFPEAGEDPYHSFLGVPLVEGGALQGVLVVQTLEPRTFSPSEIRMFVTAASQLAPLVSGAHLLERVVAATHAWPESGAASERARPSALSGIPLSPGVAFGRAYLVNGFDEWRGAEEARSRDPEGETVRLARALEAAREEITRLSQRISALVGEDHGAILQAQLMIMQDRTIEQDLNACLAAGATAEGALLKTLNKYVAAFRKLSTPYFQERVFDVKDVFRRLLWHLRPQTGPVGVGGDRLVLVAHEASVMDLFSVDLDRLAAVVVEHGGAQSHAAILARSLGVPMVGQAAAIVALLQAGQPLLVDGHAGTVYLDPTPELIVAHQPPTSPALDVNGTAEQPLPPGLPRVEANVNLLYEVPQALAHQASGVGLFRSEFLFLARRTLPTEEEQVTLYRKLLDQLGGRPATIRTFDLRPDKLAPHLHLTASARAYDWRLVLESPPVQQLFKEQVRAVLRAAATGPARILVPLVVRTEQLDFILETVAQARAELDREGLERGADVPLGVMIEVAAAVRMVETWAEHVDFFALGTNDLIASAFGLDRDDPVGAGPHDALHPGLLRLIGDVVSAAHRAGKRVTVCGEMAADPQGVLALAALQVDAVSVAVKQIGPVRRTLAGCSPEFLMALAPQILSCPGPNQVRALLKCP